MINDLIKLADELDNLGLYSFASKLDGIIEVATELPDDWDGQESVLSSAQAPPSRYSILEKPWYSEDIRSNLSEILDPNADSNLTLEELISGLEDILDVDLGDVDENGWHNINWDELENIVSKALEARVTSDDEDDFSDVMPKKDT